MNNAKGLTMRTQTFLLIAALCVSLASGQAKREAKKAAAVTPATQQAGGGKIWGVTYADFSYTAQARDTATEGRNEFDFRRVYLGYDQDISGQFAARVLLEANKADTTLGGSMNFFVKQAYVEWKNLLPMASIFFGLSPTPSLAIAEKFWGYRSLEKVILDHTGLVPVVEAGVGIAGKLVPDGLFGYALMAGNGSGGRAEHDKLKKFYGDFTYALMKGGIFELYADFENGVGGRSKFTGKGLFGYQSTAGSFCLEGFYRNVTRGSFQTAGSAADSNLVGASANGSFPLVSNVNAVFRCDFLDRDFAVKDEGLREIFAIAAVDVIPAKDIHVMPNALYTHWLYKKKLTKNPTLRDDILVRLTVAYSFSAQI